MTLILAVWIRLIKIVHFSYQKNYSGLIWYLADKILHPVNNLARYWKFYGYSVIRFYNYKALLFNFFFLTK